MYYEQLIKSNKYIKYNNRSIYDQIDTLLGLHSIFSLMLEATQKIKKSRNLDIFEEEVLRLELLDLRQDIWKCENEINRLCVETRNSYILEKVKTAQIGRMTHKITEQKPQNDNLIQTLKRLLLSISFYYLQIEELNKRKSFLKQIQNHEICEKEKTVLPIIIRSLELKIIDNYHKIHYMERWKLPSNFRHRREIIDTIEDSEIDASKVLPLESSCITVDYLKDEENGSKDLRKWKNKKWLTKRYDMFRTRRYPFLDHNYIFNFEALLNGFDRYSFKKQIEVGLASLNSYKIQLEAFNKWRRSRKKKMTEHEELIYNFMTTKYQLSLDNWDQKILQVFFIDILENHFYPSDIIEQIRRKILAADLKVNSYCIEEGSQLVLKRKIRTKEKHDEIINNYKNLENEYNEKCNHLLWAFHPGSMSGDRGYIYPSDKYDPNRAEFIKFLLTEHNLQTIECNALLKHLGTLSGYEKRFENILIKSLCVYKTHKVLLTDEKIWDAYNWLPDDYPNNEKILKEIEKAKVGLEEIKNEGDRFLYNINSQNEVPDGVKRSEICHNPPSLFLNDEPPKPQEYFRKNNMYGCGDMSYDNA